MGLLEYFKRLHLYNIRAHAFYSQLSFFSRLGPVNWLPGLENKTARISPGRAKLKHSVLFCGNGQFRSDIQLLGVVGRIGLGDFAPSCSVTQIFFSQIP